MSTICCQQKNIIGLNGSLLLFIFIGRGLLKKAENKPNDSLNLTFLPSSLPVPYFLKYYFAVYAEMLRLAGETLTFTFLCRNNANTF